MSRKAEQQLLDAQLAALAALRWLMTTTTDNAHQVGYLMGTLERIADIGHRNEINTTTANSGPEAKAAYNAVLLARINELTQ